MNELSLEERKSLSQWIMCTKVVLRMITIRNQKNKIDHGKETRKKREYLGAELKYSIINQSNIFPYQKITYKAAVIARIAKDRIANNGSV